MVYQSQLQRNTGVIDPLVYSDSLSDSYYNYTGYTTKKNFYCFYKDIAPDKTGVDWGGKTEFRLASMADKLGKIWMKFRAGPLTAGTPGDHDPRFVDWVGCHAWSSILMEYGNNEVYTLYPDEIVLRAKQSLEIADQDAIREMLAGDRTDSRRENLASVNQDFIVELPFPFTRGTDRHMELLQKAQEPRITVNWRPLNTIAQLGVGGANPSCTLSNVSLRCQLTHLEGNERDDNTARLEHPDGILRLYEDLKYETNTRDFKDGTPAMTEIRVKLNNFRSSTKSLIFYLRKLSEVRPGAGDEPNYTNFKRIFDFYLEATDGKFFEAVDDRFNRFIQWRDWHKAPSGPLIYEWSWAKEVDDVLNASGGINLGSASNLTLVIRLPSALVGDHELQIMAKEYNFTQDSRGDMMKIFR